MTQFQSERMEKVVRFLNCSNKGIFNALCMAYDSSYERCWNYEFDVLYVMHIVRKLGEGFVTDICAKALDNEWDLSEKQRWCVVFAFKKLTADAIREYFEELFAEAAADEAEQAEKNEAAEEDSEAEAEVEAEVEVENETENQTNKNDMNMKNQNEKKYMIIANCDPYNAHRHYNGQRVLRYTGTTPTAWVMEENLTKEEAHNLLNSYANEDLSVNLHYFESAEEIEELVRELDDDDEGAVVDTSFFKGSGFYNGIGRDAEAIYLEGDDSYSCDTMTYSISECDE